MLVSAKEGRGTKMTSQAWQEHYKAALLELRPVELRLRIETAEAAIHQRLREIENSADGDSDERHAIDDALRSLRTLIRTECQPQSIFASGASASEIAS
jgi:hypothetical protein